MDKRNIIEAIYAYYKSVCEAYRLGNVESSYYMPIIILFEAFECVGRDVSGARKEQQGENIDIKLWHSDEEITEIEAFIGIEGKKLEELTREQGYRLK